MGFRPISQGACPALFGLLPATTKTSVQLSSQRLRLSSTEATWVESLLELAAADSPGILSCAKQGCAEK